jgi:acetylornithine deacetylase/succinyl-diaminopimelate desuccinylase-like protein
LVRAAIDTYEALFELPPVVDKWTASVRSAGLTGAPAVAFGPGKESADERVPIHHLVKAAQFYAAFPMMFVDTLRHR